MKAGRRETAKTERVKMTSSEKVGVGIVGGIVLAILGVLFWLWGMNVIHWFTTSFREFSAFWIIAIGGAVLALVLFFVGSVKDSNFFIGLAVTSLILGVLGGAVVGIWVAPYYMAKGYYDASTQTISNSQAPSYAERAPYEFATSTSSKNLMDITGTSQTTKSLADAGTSGEWNTLITAKGIFKGYEAVQNLNLPLYGVSQNKDVKFCKFSDSATLRDHGALPHNNLSRAIYNKVPLNVDFAEGDMYSYCNQASEPVVVVPLKQIDGWLFPTWKTFGVATYNGKSGALDIVTDANQLKEIPGPVYPLSLAESQRESLIANGTLWQMVVEKTSGYVAASDNTEVNLRFADTAGSDYVTSLMPRGSSTSIVAVSHVSATSVTPGQYNTLKVEQFANENVRSANSTLIDDLKTRYSYMPDMSNDNAKVFEITSGKDGGWIASIGRDQSVNYRAYISASGSDIKLYDRNHNLIAQGSANNSSTASTDGKGGQTTTSVDMVPTSVSKLSTDELNKLGKAVMDELAKRSK